MPKEAETFQPIRDFIGLLADSQVGRNAVTMVLVSQNWVGCEGENQNGYITSDSQTIGSDSVANFTMHHERGEIPTRDSCYPSEKTIAKWRGIPCRLFVVARCRISFDVNHRE